MNPAFLSYVSDFDPALAAPTGMLVAGPNNWLMPGFQASRDKGMEVYAYYNFMERPDVIKPTNTLQLDAYMGDPAMVPLWGNGRIHWPGTMMTDIRPSSAWTAYALDWCEKLIKEGKIDGLFLDVLGSRPWGDLVKWDTWPIGERTDWTASCLDFVKELDRIRRRVNDRFIIITNNFWNTTSVAEQYIDGICLEKNPVSAFHTAYARRAFGSLGHRRVLVVARNDIEAAEWVKQAGPTHITSIDGTKGQTYLKATPRYIGAAYEDLRYSEALDYIEILKGRIKDLDDEYDKLLDDNIKQIEDNKVLKDSINNAILDLGGIPSGQ